jgi:hypothetical protein
LVEDETEQAAIARMRAMRDGGASLRSIAAAMACEGVTITHAGVAKVLGR